MNPPVPAPTPTPAENREDSELTWGGLSHVGRYRSNNEDAFLMLKSDGCEILRLGKTGQASLRGADYIFAVSDGLGGARSGEFASRMAADRITQFFVKTFRMPADKLAALYRELLNDLFITIHKDLMRLGQCYEECAGMGATLSLCWISHRRLFFGHIGDSRIYHLPRGGALRQLTHDHSHVGWLQRQGQLNEREARMHPRRNALQQALGAGHQFVEPQIAAVPYQAGDRFLICSDGLIDGLWDRRLAELLAECSMSGQEPGPEARLVAEAVEASGRDNVTAVVVQTPAPAGAETEAGR